MSSTQHWSHSIHIIVSNLIPAKNYSSKSCLSSLDCKMSLGSISRCISRTAIRLHRLPSASRASSVYGVYGLIHPYHRFLVIYSNSCGALVTICTGLTHQHSSVLRGSFLQSTHNLILNPNLVRNRHLLISASAAYMMN